VLIFSPKADKHNVPRHCSWYVGMTTQGEPAVMNWGEPGLFYTGTDEYGVELEVGTVQRGSDELVVHSMPTAYRHNSQDRKK